jgi:Flp pilus assembly pilin Flp
MYVSVTQILKAKAAIARRVGPRLRWTLRTLADRVLVASLVTAIAITPAVLAGWRGDCLPSLAAFLIVAAAATSLTFQPTTRFRRFAVAVERGINSIEVLICAALVSLVIVGVAVQYGRQHASVTNEVNAQALRDVGSAIDVDAAAISAYDSNARAAYTGLGQQNTTVTVNGQTAKIKLNGAASGLDVSVTTPDGSQANLLAPLPIAKPTPQ